MTEVAEHVKLVAGNAAGAAVFTARGLTKVYRMGEVEVHALRGVDLDIFAFEFVAMRSGETKQTDTLNFNPPAPAPTTTLSAALPRKKWCRLTPW